MLKEIIKGTSILTLLICGLLLIDSGLSNTTQVLIISVLSVVFGVVMVFIALSATKDVSLFGSKSTE